MTSVLAAPSLGDAASKVIVPILSQFLIVVHLSVYCSTKRCFPLIQAVGEFRGLLVCYTVDRGWDPLMHLPVALPVTNKRVRRGAGEQFFPPATPKIEKICLLQQS
jgi:hypothetical protein